MIRIIPILLFCLSANATDFCVGVTSSGSGNGSDWNNKMQWSSFTPARGSGDNVYYVEDGSYAAKTFSTAVDGTKVITIRKATPSAHGSSTGWSDTMGDGEAVITAQVWFKTDYWIFDGVWRGDHTRDATYNLTNVLMWRTNYGLRVNNNNGSDVPNNNTSCIQVGDDSLGSGGNNGRVTVQFVEMQGSHHLGNTYADQGYFSTFTTGRTVSNSVRYCFIHDTGGVPIAAKNSHGFMSEYNFLMNHKSTSDLHAEGYAFKETTAELTVRWSFNENCEGTSIYSDPSGGAGFSYTNWFIYGNVELRNQAETNGTHFSGSGLGGGIMNIHNYDFFYGILLYANNTIYNIDEPPGSGRATLLINSDGVRTVHDVYVVNNLSYSCNTENSPESDVPANTTVTGTWLWDYHHYVDSNNNLDNAANKTTGTGSPFVNVSQTVNAIDFRLASATTAGVALPSPYNVAPYTVDMFGNTRGSDGTADRGAIEFDSGGGSAAPPASIPPVIRLKGLRGL